MAMKSGVKRARATDRHQLIKRLEALLAKQVTNIEAGLMEQSPDKEIALLGNLARTLEKLIELDEKQALDTPPKRDNGEMVRLRKRLADRMKTLGLD